MYWPDINVIKEQRSVVVDGLTAVFFLNASHNELFLPVKKCLKQYIDFVGWESVPFYITDDGYADPTTPEVIDKILHERFHEEESGITLLGSDMSVSPFEFHYFGSPLPVERWPSYRNLLYCWLPKDLALLSGLERIVAFVKSIATQLPFSFAYCNPALLYHHNDIGEATSRAKRYPGVDVLSTGSVSMELGDRAAGVYWLSLLGTELARHLGGFVQLRTELPTPIIVEQFQDDKIIIQLGPEPEVGDVNRQTDFPLHRQLARILEPVLHMPIRNYFADRDGESDPQAMHEWHRRFL